MLSDFWPQHSLDERLDLMACAKDYMSQTCSNDSLFRNCQLLLCDLGVDVLNTNFPSILTKSEFFSQVQYCLLREPRELRCNTFL